MNNPNLPRKLSRVGIYLPKALKFYDIRYEILTPVLFIIVLATSLSGDFFPNLSKTWFAFYLYYLVSGIIISLTSSLYLMVYIREIKGETKSFKVEIYGFAKLIPKIIIAAIIYNFIVLAGFFALIIPGIILYTMFIFNMCFIVDKNESVSNSFRFSRLSTEKRKMQIFGMFFVLNLMFLMPAVFIYLASYGASPMENNITADFILSFVISIINFVQQRLTALMYVDLEYGNKDSEQAI